MRGGACRVSQVVESIEDRNQIVARPRKVLGSGDGELDPV